MPPTASGASRRCSPDAAGGLASTVDDYLAFGQMLLSNGQHSTGRILSRPSIQTMTTDQLAPGQRESADVFLGTGRGWGFGLSMVNERDDVAAVPGRLLDLGLPGHRRLTATIGRGAARPDPVP